MSFRSTVIVSRARRPDREPLRNRMKRLRGYISRYRRLRLNLKHQHAVLPRSRARAADPANSTEFLINFPGSPNNIETLASWLPVFESLRAHASVAVLVGDVSTYESVHRATDLPCYFGRIATEAEFVAQQLQTKVMLYLNQSKLNLREAGFHDMFHVYLGAPGGARAKWLSNRMRLYDYILAPDAASKAWLASRLMNFDADSHVRVVGRESEPEGTIDHLGAALGVYDVVEAGVDPDRCVRELLAIRDERDRVVSEREAELAARGIVLLKGGQA